MHYIQNAWLPRGYFWHPSSLKTVERKKGFFKKSYPYAANYSSPNSHKSKNPKFCGKTHFKKRYLLIRTHIGAKMLFFLNVEIETFRILVEKISAFKEILPFYWVSEANLRYFSGEKNSKTKLQNFAGNGKKILKLKIPEVPKYPTTNTWRGDSQSPRLTKIEITLTAS